MQLNEILEENNAKDISVKTNISEDNIEALLAKNFKNLPKSKALGFISIIERDYNADLGEVKEQALVYYKKHHNEGSISLSIPQLEEKKRRSIWAYVLILGLLAYASWYFFTQFDKKTFNTILSFTEKKDKTVEEASSIKKALSSTKVDDAGVQTDIVEMSLDTVVKTNHNN